MCIDGRNLNVALFRHIPIYRLNKEAIMVRAISFVIALLLISNIASAQNRARPNAAPDDDACKADSHRYCQRVFPAQRDLPSTIRHAIRAARKMQIAYQDGDRRSTER